MKKWKVSLLVAVSAVLFAGLGAAGSWLWLSRRASETNKYAQISAILNNYWYYGDQVENIDESMLSYGVAGNVTEVLDPYTQYMSNEQSGALNLKLQGTSAGIGVVVVNENDQVLVSRVYVNSPADLAGLLPGDTIVRLDDVILENGDVSQVPELIAQANGDAVEVEILRDGQPMVFTITPDNFDSTVSMEVVDGVGVVLISSFSNHTGADFYEALERLEAQGIENLVIDLRSNTGGTTDAAIKVASALLEPGELIYQEQFANGDVIQYAAGTDTGTVSFDQIFILQNDQSASSAEIVIGALKDNLGDQVITVGQTSYGKGSVQDRYTFEDGTTLKFTRSLWLTPNGTSINRTGFTPDVEVELLVPALNYSGEVPLEADSVNADASAFQTLLGFLGYEVDRTDNYFSPLSAQALIQFQLDNGLEATGIGDQETFDLLLKTARAKAAEYGDRELQAVMDWLEQREF